MFRPVLRFLKAFAPMGVALAIGGMCLLVGSMDTAVPAAAPPSDLAAAAANMASGLASTAHGVGILLVVVALACFPFNLHSWRVPNAACASDPVAEDQDVQVAPDASLSRSRIGGTIQEKPKVADRDAESLRR